MDPFSKTEQSCRAITSHVKQPNVGILSPREFLTYIFVLERKEPLLEVGSHCTSVLLKPFLLCHFQNSKPCSCADWIATEGVEIGAAGEDICNLRSCHHCPERDPTSNSLRTFNAEKQSNCEWRISMSARSVCLENEMAFDRKRFLKDDI